MEDINREKILEEIREEIKEKGYKVSDITFGKEELPEQTVPYSEEIMTRYCRWIDQAIDKSIEADDPVGNPVKIKIKQILRKIVYKILVPAFEKQECVNISVSDAVNMIAYYMREKDREISELKKRLTELEMKQG